MTKAGIKTEDYRKLTPFWCNRFLLFNGENKSKEWWRLMFFEARSMQKTIISLNGNTTFKKFTTNTMTLGYPKNGDTERILQLEHKGIEIRTGKYEWGAEPDVLYFVIMHGAVLA